MQSFENTTNYHQKQRIIRWTTPFSHREHRVLSMLQPIMVMNGGRVEKYGDENMKRTPMLLFAVYLGSLMVALAPVPTAQAQGSVTPMITLTCNDQIISIDVAPGKTRDGSTMCSVQNPTAYDETVSIQIVSSPGIAVAASGTLSIGAGQTADFPIGVLAPVKAEMKDHPITVTATVTHVNGITNTQSTTQNMNMIVSIKQFSMVQIVAQNSFTQLRPKVDYTFVFDVYNHGNQQDKMRFSIPDKNLDDLREDGFQITLPAVSMEMQATDTPYKVRINVRTPKNQGWTDEYFQMEFQTQSDFSCREEDCLTTETQMITIYVRGVYLPGFEIIPALSMIALAAAVLGRRFINDEEEEEPETESSVC